MPYEVFEHTADVGIRVQAGTLAGLFAEAGEALLEVFVDNPESVRASEKQTLEIEAEAVEELFFDWLSRLHLLYAADRMLFSRLELEELQMGDGEHEPVRLQAVAHGEPADDARHRFNAEVKAITYHELKVERVADGWRAEVIVDI